MSDTATPQGPGPLLDSTDPTLRALAATAELSGLLGQGERETHSRPTSHGEPRTGCTPNGHASSVVAGEAANPPIGRNTPADNHAPANVGKPDGGQPDTGEPPKPSQAPDGARGGFGTMAKADVAVGQLSEADQLRGLELVAIASMALDALEM